MITPKESESANEICEKMNAKGYTTFIRADNKIMLMMNKAFKDLLDKHGFPTEAGSSVNFGYLLFASFDWVLNEQGEGVVLLHDKNNLTLFGL